MTALKNHPGKKLRADAAASLARIEAKHGIITVNSAWRTPAEQQELINRWKRGGKGNRPPYLYEPASIKASNHLDGKAFDTSNINFMLTTGKDHGWVRTHLYDKVHFVYFPERDKFKGSGSAPAATKGSVKVKNEQNFLNQYRGEKLKTDGIRGDNTEAAVRRYQSFLKSRWGYKGVIDGNWGLGTQAAHAKYYESLKKGTTPPKVAGFSQTVKNQQDFLILKRGERSLVADGRRGPATVAAFKRYQQFLKKGYGYRGTIDGVWGSGMQAAHAKYYAKVK